MKLSKIHRFIKFKKSNWLEEYIDFNAEKRKNSKNSFERNLFKLLVNSIYGKCMENIRKRINIKLIKNSKDYARYLTYLNQILSQGKYLVEVLFPFIK